MTEFTPRISPIRSRVRFATIAILAFLTCAALPHTCFAQTYWHYDYAPSVTPPQFEFYPGPDGGREVDSVTGTVTVEGVAPSSQYFSPAAGPYVSSDYWFGGSSVNGDSTFANQPWTPPGLPPLIYTYGVSDQVTDTMSNYMFYTGPSPTPTTQTFLITPIISATASVSGSASAQASLTDDFGDTASVSQNFQPQYNYKPHLVTISPDQSTGIASYTFNAYYTSASSLGGAGRASADISEAFAMTPDTRKLVLGAATSAKCAIQDSGPITDGNIYWPDICDAYGNIQYQAGSEQPGHGDLGLPYYSSIEDQDPEITTETYVSVAPGSWGVSGSQYKWSSSEHNQYNNSGTLQANQTIPNLSVSYWNPDPTDEVAGDVNTTDNIALTYTDGTDGATDTATLQMNLHHVNVATEITGPSSQSDTNFYSYVTTALAWPYGQPTSDNQSYTISSNAAAAVCGALSAGGDDMQVLSTQVADDPLWAAICETAGLTLDDISNGIADSSGSISRDVLWPAYADSQPYPSQWGSGSPAEHPSNSTAPADWTSSTTLPSEVTETCVCNPYNVDRYENNLYGVDCWGTTGYTSYSEQLLGKWNDENTIGMWTVSANPGGRGG